MDRRAFLKATVGTPPFPIGNTFTEHSKLMVRLGGVKMPMYPSTFDEVYMLAALTWGLGSPRTMRALTRITG